MASSVPPCASARPMALPNVDALHAAPLVRASRAVRIVRWRGLIFGSGRLSQRYAVESPTPQSPANSVDESPTRLRSLRTSGPVNRARARRLSMHLSICESSDTVTSMRLPLLTALVFVLLPACGSTARYVVAQSIWDTWQSADHVAAGLYREACPERATTPEAQAQCRERLDRLETVVHLDTTTSVSLDHLIRSGRDLAASAVIGLFAAEDGSAPPDLQARLSCVAAAVHSFVFAIQELGVRDWPPALDTVLEAINRYGGSARILLLGQCPGFDGAGHASGSTGSSPAPAQGAGSGATGDAP